MNSLKYAGMVLLTGVAMQANADPIIYRIADEGVVIGYDSLTDFYSNTQSTNATDPHANYIDDGWFYFASKI